jgi:hypothetical protein
VRRAVEWAVKGELRRRCGDAAPNGEVQFSATLHARIDTEQDLPHGVSWVNALLAALSPSIRPRCLHRFSRSAAAASRLRRTTTAGAGASKRPLLSR